MSVTLLLRDYTQDENTLTAALLHDTIEDTDYTAEELRRDFGQDVHNIVAALSEPELNAAGEKPTWIEKKELYASQIAAGPKQTAMIVAADKMHNFRSMMEEYADDRERFAKDFGGDMALRERAYQAIADAVTDQLKGEAILDEFTHVFELYKQFLNHG